jgi:hypothetical protein
VATVAHVDARYTADTSAYVRAVRDAQRATQAFADQLPQVDKAVGEVKASTIAFGAALGTLGAQALTRATGMVKQFAMQGIQAAKDYEQTVISIEGIFVGMGKTVEQATSETKTYLGDLRDFAAATPFELPQILDAVKRLLSIGYAANEVKDTILPAVGDIVAALGQPPQAVQAVVYAFGQMKSAGRVMSQDLMQIGNALPGFNAKMEIAKELFNGDMQAMTKAVESGALDSETAINTMIKAMQKFPGAAGAMERQSKTLSGVISTFNDTVNNALIDGLMPSMPILSEALMGVMPAVEAMAEGFAQQLGPALIQGATLMQDLVPILSAIIPPLFQLVSTFTGMADILAAMAGPLIAVAEGLGSLLDLFGALPGPIQTFVAVMGTLILLSRRYSVAWKAANAQVLASFATMKTGAQLAAGGVLISVTNVRAGIQLMAITAKSAAVAVVGAFRTMATAAKGLLTSLGPIGWALIGVSVAFEVFSGKAAEGEALVSRLKDTVDETTGALTAMSAQMMGTQFRIDLSSEDQAALAQLGVGVTQAVDAIMKGPEAAEAFNQQLQHLINTSSGAQRDLLITWQRNYQGMADAATDTAAVIASEEAAKADALTIAANQQMANNRAMSASLRTEAAERRANTETTYAQYSGMAAAHQSYTDAAVRNQDRVTAVTNTTEAAVRALKDTYSELDAIISGARAADRATAALREMKEQLAENTAGIDKNNEAATANRDSVLSYAEAQMAYAKSLQDPQQELAALIDLEAEVKAGLKGQGIKPSESDLYNSIKGSIDASKQAVENMGDAVAAAETAGLDVSNAIAQGITAGMSEQESAINAAGLVGGETLIDGMNAGAGVSSPSTFAITAGRMVGVGMVQGLIQTSSQVRNTGSVVGSALVQGMIVSLNNGQGPVAAAARQVVEAAIRAAKAAGEIKSPSRVFMAIGDDLIKGLKLGWLRGAQDFVQSVARTAQDAYFAMKDASDRVADARKALKEIREERKKGEATAREVAAAERALAMALRDSADAAEEYRVAMKNVAAARKLATMPRERLGDLRTTLMADLASGAGIDGAWDAMSQRLYDRARNAGMTREAAQAYADSVMSNVSERFEVQLRELEKLTGRLNEINAEIKAIEDRMAAREEARQSLASFFEKRFGQSSEFEKAYNSASISVDQAIQLFDKFEEMIRARLDGYEDGVADPTVEYLRKQTQALVDLINKREDLAKKLADAEAKFAEATRVRDDAEKKFADSIRNFSKISGNVSSTEEFIKGLEQRAAATATYIKNIEALRKKGVSGSVIQQILEAGPEQGGSFAAVLAGATAEQVAYINSLTAKNEETAAQFGDTQAGIMYDAGVTSAKKLRDGLQSEYDGVVKQIGETVAGIQTAIAPLLDVGYAAGRDLLAQTLAGLEAEKTVVLAAITAIGEEIARAWQAALTPPATGGGGGGGGNRGGNGGGNRTGRSATTTYVPSVGATGAPITVASGGVQVQVSVGDGANAAAVSSTVKLAVMEALAQVAQQAQTARR